MLIVCGCTFQFPASKTLYTLNTKDEFLISNMYSNSFKLEKKGKEVELTYDIVLKNLKDSERSINLESSQALNKAQIIPLNCLRYNSDQKVFKIKPQEQARILCSGILNKNITSSGDTKLIITIPLENESASFLYLVREEDFK